MPQLSFSFHTNRFMTVFYAYAALAFSAFTSATLLPGTSEAAFVLFVHRFSEHAYGALLCAGLANGLGSMVSYWMGRLLPSRKMPSEKTIRIMKRYGVWLLAFAWLPVVGDALPLAAGWLRLNPWTGGLMLIAGKMARYAFILWGIQYYST